MVPPQIALMEVHDLEEQATSAFRCLAHRLQDLVTQCPMNVLDVC